MPRELRGASSPEVTYVMKRGVSMNDNVRPSTPEGLDIQRRLRQELEDCLQDERRMLRDMHNNPNGGWTTTKSDRGPAISLHSKRRTRFSAVANDGDTEW